MVKVVARLMILEILIIRIIDDHIIIILIICKQVFMKFISLIKLTFICISLLYI